MCASNQSSIASPYRKALLTSLVAPGSSHWLSTIPTQPAYRMKDEAVRLACRHRLGLLPFDQLMNRNCSCIKHDSFNDDPDHFHSCVKHKRTALTYRHDNIVQVVCDLARLCGFSATREPNGHIRPENIANSKPSSEEYNQHADILLVKYDMKLYLDVCYCPSNYGIATQRWYQRHYTHHYIQHERTSMDTSIASTMR
jgi:hypothetical protein